MFTEAERAYASGLRRPEPSLAARFAAKEAVMKCLSVGVGSIAWHDVEVVRAASGAPSLRVQGRALVLARSAGITGWELSLTHTDHVATAVAAALG